MYFGGACRAAAAVTSGSAAQKNYDIVRIRCLTNDILSRRRTHHRTDLHSLCHIIRMINLLDQSGRKSDLIAVGRITARRPAHQLLLGQLALKRLRHRHRRISRTRHAHRLIHITASRQGITDRAAKTRRRPAERLDLRRMVVGLILEKDKPLLRHLPVTVIHLHGNHHRAGIDLIGFLHVIQLPVLL